MARSFLFFCSIVGVLFVACAVTGCADSGTSRGASTPVGSGVQHTGQTQDSGGSAAVETTGRSRAAERRSGSDSSGRRADTGSTRPTGGSGPRGGPPPKR